MAKVNIKGIGNTTLPRAIAERLRLFKNDLSFSPTDKYQQDGLDVEKRDIGPIFLDDFEVDDKQASADRKDENEAYSLQKEKEYQEDIRRRCKKTWHEKAKDIVHYETIYLVSGQKPTPDFKEKITERQTVYFQKNPRHPFAIVEVKDLLPVFKRRGDSMQISSLVPGRVIELVYKSMYQALHTAKRMGEI